MNGEQETIASNWYSVEVEKLREGILSSSIDSTALLTATRQEFYKSLDTFYAQVRHLISLYFAVFVGLGFILNGIDERPQMIIAISGILLLLVAGMSFFAYRIISAQYSLYVSGVIYSAQFHAALNIDTHYWFDEVRIFKKGALDKKEIINKWMWQNDSTAKNYFFIVVIFTLAACLSGLGLLIWAFK